MSLFSVLKAVIIDFSSDDQWQLPRQGDTFYILSRYAKERSSGYAACYREWFAAAIGLC